MLTDQQIESYHRDGYTVARGLFSAEDVARMKTEIDAVWDRCGRGEKAQNTAFAGVKKMSTIRDPQLHSGVFTRYLTDPKLTGPMSQLLGPDVQLHHSKVNIKTQDDRTIFPLHQDAPYFPHEQNSLCTVLVHLTTTTSERGCFRVIPGVKEMLPHVHDEGHILPPDEYPLERAEELPAAAGDVVFMSSFTPHGSNLNTTDEPRVLWIIQIRSPTDHPIEQPAGTLQPTAPGNRPSQGTMLCGINPDFERAASGESSRL
ncbi:MAG: phytanoyl-CoA dioxygenase family protein [Planctomycetes bacterium]|nr:phytanoyl-CoA dioxygenase family protein [Planctomycetota bacterium]